MIWQFLTIFLRSISRQRVTFFINLSGMILGLIAIILAIVLITDEVKFDAFHADDKLIFRVNKWYTEPGDIKSKNAETPGLMAQTLLADFPEINYATRWAPWFDEVLLSHEDRNIYTDKWVFADPGLFNVFSFKILSNGSPKDLLSAPGQVLITPELGNKIFGREDPVGKLIKGVGDKDYQITGLIESPPRQSHLKFDVIASYASTDGQYGFLDFSFMNNWLGQTVYTYLKLYQPGDVHKVNQRLPEFTSQYMANRTDMYDFYLQPLNDIYLHSSDVRFLRGGTYGSYNFLKSFGIIALIILFIACFNYINITTARSLQRSKEVGVKKVLGASKQQLTSQFLFETLALIAISSIVAFVGSSMILPELNNYFDKNIPVSALWNPIVLVILGLVVLITTLLAGALPGMILANYKPIQVLKSSRITSPGGFLPRQVLTSVQLCVGIGLISASIVYHKQFEYMMNKDLGFDRNQVLTMNTPPGIDSSYLAFLNELDQIQGITSVSMCQATMHDGTFGTTVLTDGSDRQEVPVQAFRVDTNYQKTYGLELIAGRFFDRTSDFTSGSVVVNEAMVKQMGWEDPLEGKITFREGDPPSPVIGVVHDFHYRSLNETITPVVMYLTNRRGNISIRFKPDQVDNLLAQLLPLWKKFEKRYPFDYNFLDEHYANNYLKESRMTRVITLFTIIAILIGCMGIYGLTSFSILRRRREIGIRKILGSTNLGIFQLLSHRFLYPLIAAFVIAIPIVNIILNSWLESYAYHMQIRIGYYLIAGGLMTIIVLLTIGSQSIKAAMVNPTVTLKEE